MKHSLIGEVLYKHFKQYDHICFVLLYAKVSSERYCFFQKGFFFSPKQKEVYILRLFNFIYLFFKNMIKFHFVFPSLDLFGISCRCNVFPSLDL